MSRGTRNQQPTKDLMYGAHASKLKEKDSFLRELVDQLRDGNVAMFNLADFKHLQGLWLPPLVVIPQVGRKPCIIYNFSWIFLKEHVKQAATKQAIRFEKVLHCLLDFIIEADPYLGPTYLRKVYLAESYMHILFSLIDIPSVVFLVNSENEYQTQLVGFNIYTPIGYAEPAPFFCVAGETIKYQSKNTLHTQGCALLHNLKELTDTPQLETDTANSQ